MSDDKSTELAIQQIIEEKIYFIRGQKVMLDRDLAVLYEVPTFRLNEQVKRNKKRFPEDFMFQLTKEENDSLRSQIAILNEEEDSLRSQFATSNENNESLTSQFAMSNNGRGGRRTFPYAFTEQGVAMLSSVLNSDRAIQVNIEIMRTFIKLRNILSEHKDLLKKIEEMEKNYDRQFRIVFQIIRELTVTKDIPSKRIGFKAE